MGGQKWLVLLPQLFSKIEGHQTDNHPDQRLQLFTRPDALPNGRLACQSNPKTSKNKAGNRNKLTFMFLIVTFKRIIAKLIIETINNKGMADSTLFVI